MESEVTENRPNVALFVTCLVDAFRPEVGFATVRLLEQAGCEVSVPTAQTCCGQPAFNSGDREGARRVARTLLDCFAGFDYVVAPSGSCAAMVRLHLPGLFDAGEPGHGRAHELAARCWELTAFLSDVRKFVPLDVRCNARVTYHDSCSGLRELGVRDQPRRLLDGVRGLSVTEHDMAEVCCGFGGLFCAKYPEISAPMRDRKADDIRATGAEMVVAGDLGCLMQLAGNGRSPALPGRHVAEILAGMDETPPLGVEG